MREGFTETFKPLIETSEKVKESIDTEQNKLIQQLQENQLALTQGLEGNRKAITSGFDKMDEVKKWDLEQLPGYEAIEEPEEYESADIIKKIKILDARMIKNLETQNEIGDLAIEANEEGKENEYNYYMRKIKELEVEYKKLEKERERIKEILEKESEEPVEKQKKTILEYKKEDMDKFLNNKDSIDLLKFYGLKLPSKYKDSSLGELQKAFEKGMEETANLKKSIKNVAEYRKDVMTGLILAYPIKGQQSKEKSKELIKDYNIMQIFIINMGQLRNYKKLTGTGIIHFNNPQQLVKRLELLAGSIIAGNIGVKQEFSQIAHLLHQLKVITKKTLNDLLKKYILFK